MSIVTVDPRGAPRRPRTRVVLLGLGTVGGGVYQRLRERPDEVEIAACAIRDLPRHRREHPGAPLTDDPWRALEAPADIVVELIGGIEPARALVLAALERGRSVVTANKTLMASCGGELEAVARERGVALLYSAAVGGEVPVLENIDRSPAPVRRVRGLLSGTANFILSAIAGGRDYAGALREAQARGLAEADPTKDVSGADTAEKLALIARRAFGRRLPVSDIDTRGIDNLDPRAIRAAAARGGSFGLVAECLDAGDRVIARVTPRALEPGDPLAGAEGAENRVIIETAAGETRVLAGLGAGRWPTTTAVFADISTIAAHRGDLT